MRRESLRRNRRESKGKGALKEIKQLDEYKELVKKIPEKAVVEYIVELKLTPDAMKNLSKEIEQEFVGKYKNEQEFVDEYVSSLKEGEFPEIFEAQERGELDLEELQMLSFEDFTYTKSGYVFIR